MEIKPISPNFGMAHKKTESAKKYIENLGMLDSFKASELEKASINNPIDVFFSTIVKDGKEKLKAEVGYKTFVESFFKSPIKVIQESTKFANKLEKEQAETKKLVKGMTRPTLK